MVGGRLQYISPVERSEQERVFVLEGSGFQDPITRLDRQPGEWAGEAGRGKLGLWGQGSERGTY